MQRGAGGYLLGCLQRFLISSCSDKNSFKISNVVVIYKPGERY